MSPLLIRLGSSLMKEPAPGLPAGSGKMREAPARGLEAVVTIAMTQL